MGHSIDDLFNKISEVKQEVIDLQQKILIAPNQIIMTTLSQLSEDLGVIKAGHIAGWDIGQTTLTDKSSVVGMSSEITAGDDIRFWAGHATPSSAPFQVLESGALIATSATISGAITATSGSIGGWVVGAADLKDAAGVVGLSSAVTGGDDIRIWAGHSTPSSAPFRVTEAGVLVATSATISGAITATSGAIGGWTIDSNSIRKLTANVGIIIDSSTPAIKVGDTAGTYIIIDGANKRIRSSNYVTLASGFNIDADTGDAEFNNLSARGRIKTAVFEKDSISVVGGNLLVLSGDSLAVDMTSLDASTLTIYGEVTFAVGDILRLKDDINDEWLEVTNIASAPTYTVTRDKASTYGADANPAWKKGQAVVNYGQSGDGGILLQSGASPAMYLFNHAGSPWSTITNEVTLDENGILAGTAVRLNSSGIAIDIASLGSYDSAYAYKVMDGANEVFTMYSYIDSTPGVYSAIASNGTAYGAATLAIIAESEDAHPVAVQITAVSGNSVPSEIILDQTSITLSSPDAGIVIGSAISINDAGTDVDTTIKGSTDSNLFYVDAGADTVQIGAATSPNSRKFYVNGEIEMASGGAIYINNVGVLAFDRVTLTGSAPFISLSDTTASAKDLTIKVDGNEAGIYESAGAATSGIRYDLANNKISFGGGSQAMTGLVNLYNSSPDIIFGRDAAAGWGGRIIDEYGNEADTIRIQLAAGSWGWGEGFRFTYQGNFKVGGDAIRSTTQPTNAMTVFNGTAPAGTLTNGATLYAQSGEMYLMNAAGLAQKLMAGGAMQVFTSDGTYTPSSGMKYCIVVAIGGGGGGGGADCTDTTALAAAGGGEGGGLAMKMYTAAEIGASASVTIGTAGTAGDNTGTAGGDGGDTTFDPAGTGATITGLGGDGGDGVSTGVFTVGVGGTAESGGTNGTLNVPGQSGTTGRNSFDAVGGDGGNSAWLGHGGKGGWGIDGNAGVAGTDGGGYGGGGGGAGAYNNTTGAAGGAGSAGAVIVVEFT